MPKRPVVENVFVQCPYYKYERESVIYCEGIEANNSVHMAFASKTQRQEYEKQFCQNCWAKCMIADAQNRRWEYEV